MRNPAPVTTDQVIDIFRRKTSPAFQVALGIGAALAGATAETQEVLREYSDALGIAYQIRDDLEDLSAPSSDTDGFGAPTLLLALACAKAKATGRDEVLALWRGGRTSASDRAAFKTHGPRDRTSKAVPGRSSRPTRSRRYAACRRCRMRASKGCCGE